jgi:hypothetical protein
VSTEAVSPVACPISPRATRTPNYDPRMLGGGSIVPYISAWSGEEISHPDVVPRGLGIGYEDEMPTDRDRQGVLWTRRTSLIGAGKPLFVDMHPVRQRLAMQRMLCQVCARPASRTEEGYLWLLPKHPGYQLDLLRYAPTTTPPVCIECARLSVRMCPRLRSSYVALRAHPRVFGVSGVRVDLGRIIAPINDGDGFYVYGEPAIHEVIAVNQACLLYDHRFVDMDQLADVDV